jgi:hypothetical protein
MYPVLNDEEVGSARACSGLAFKFCNADRTFHVSNLTSGGRGLIYSLVNNRLRYLALIAAFLTASSLHGQETCSEEVKLLLSPAQVRIAVPALQAGRERHGRVYFYDTPALDLLSKGVILRLRERAEIDLTAKLRPLSGEKFVGPSGGRERYKCEVDLNNGIEAQSFSVERAYADAKLPERGPELFGLLSEGQKKLLEDANVQIDWKRVRRIAAIRSTSWTTQAKAPLGELSLELWEWPGGSVLEVSTKVGRDAGQLTYVELRELAKKNGLALSADQRSKTAIALKAITAARQP